MRSFQGVAAITDAGVKKHFEKYQPQEAIFELVWNGFDADATFVDISISVNEMDGLEAVWIVDNGEGINLDELSNTFEKFNESSKKDNENKHGSHGKGRLSFYKLCSSASWYTKQADVDGVIKIDAEDIKSYEGGYLNKNEQHSSLKKFPSGTCVVLEKFGEYNLPENSEILLNLSNEFGWLLALNSNLKIRLDGTEVPIPEHELHEKTEEISDNEFHLQVVRWEDKPSSVKSFNYLIDDKSKIIEKRFSKTNNKVTFYTSAYASSDWLNTYDPEALEIDEDTRGRIAIKEKLYAAMTVFQREIYSEYLRKHVDAELDRYEEQGYFPEYSGVKQDYADWRRENTRSFVKQIYLADPKIFSSLGSKPTKLLIRLIDAVVVSNENDVLIDVLDSVLDLSSANAVKLAEQLKVTTFENIIGTIEVLQKRQNAVVQLREIMENRYTEVLETPDLQKIIENNTWLFGPQYTILGAEEDTFTKIAKNLRSRVKDIDVVLENDIESGESVEGANRQVDLFLARKLPTVDVKGDQVFKCVIVEIKRPSVSLNKKHLQQIEDYCEIISKHAGFSSSKMIFEVLLIGRKVSKGDYHIRQRLDSMKDKAEFGLVASSGNIKCFVKDWFTIFDEFELSNNYMLSRLSTRLEEYSEADTSTLVEELQGVGS